MKKIKSLLAKSKKKYEREDRRDRTFITWHPIYFQWQIFNWKIEFHAFSFAFDMANAKKNWSKEKTKNETKDLPRKSYVQRCVLRIIYLIDLNPILNFLFFFSTFTMCKKWYVGVQLKVNFFWSKSSTMVLFLFGISLAFLLEGRKAL